MLQAARQKASHSQSTQRPETSNALQSFHSKFTEYLEGKATGIEVIKHNNIITTRKSQIVRKSSMVASPLFQSKSRIQNQQVDLDDVKEFISSREELYNEDITIRQSHKSPTLRSVASFSRRSSYTRPQYDFSLYKESKRLDRLAEIAQSYRSQIKRKNLISPPQADKVNTKNTMVTKQTTVIKHQENIQNMAQQLKYIKLENTCPSAIVQVYQKSFRAKSDYFMKNPTYNSTQLKEIGDLDNYELKFGSKSPKFRERLQTRVPHFQNLKRNNRLITNSNESEDSSVVSETEAKLNNLYTQSQYLQKKLLNPNENPNRIITYINKIDSISNKIVKVSLNKLKTSPLNP